MFTLEVVAFVVKSATISCIWKLLCSSMSCRSHRRIGVEWNVQPLRIPTSQHNIRLRRWERERNKDSISRMQLPSTHFSSPLRVSDRYQYLRNPQRYKRTDSLLSRRYCGYSRPKRKWRSSRCLICSVWGKRACMKNIDETNYSLNDSFACWLLSLSFWIQVWPLVCLWYMCFVIFLCCSYKGRHAITYCVQRCFPNMNTYIVNRILHQRVLQEQRIWTFWADNRPTTNSSESDDTPTELVLKTKLFHAVAIESRSEGLPSLLSPMPTSNEGENDDDPAFCCTICFAPLEEGDRIGDLPCDHGYHVECLKGWVQRKNTCPLCAIPLATPRSKPSHEQQQERRGSENV